jgi:hypothetical protein
MRQTGLENGLGFGPPTDMMHWHWQGLFFPKQGEYPAPQPKPISLRASRGGTTPPFSAYIMSQQENGWGARIRTWEWRYQKPLPYRLATPQ